MELVSEAIAFAVKAHDGMRRKKSAAPYILHPLEAMTIVGSMTNDQELLAASVLHDVVEDTDISLDTIEQLFGPRVRFLVQSETEDKREHLPASQTWQIRKEESLEVLRNATDPDVLILWLGDKLSNMRSIHRDWKIEGDALWQRFNQSDPAAQAWYYTSIARLTESLSHTMAWREYKSLTDIVFGKGK